MEQDERIPRFSHDLIERLDADTPVPQLPFTVSGWSELGEDRVRQLAFMSGMRAMVDMLMEWAREEDEDGDDTDTGADGGRWPVGRTVDDFGKYQEVVSVDLAGHLLAPQSRPDPDEEQ